MSLESKQYLMRITDRPDLVMVRGAGSYLWDTNGRRYLDFVQGWAVNALGHSAREVAAALAEQAAKLCTASPALHNASELELAARLCRLSGMAQAHFASSGAEANEAALKLVRKWGERERGGAYEVVTTHGSFHGRTMAMMSASGKPGWDQMFRPQLAGFVKVPYGDPNAVRAAIGPRTVAVMVEPIQGEGGVVVPPPGYLRALRSLCDAHRVLLVLDEVQTGIGRTGTLFAWQSAGVLPDVMTLGKGLGGGVPISALLAAPKACCFEPGDQGGTYNGNSLVTAVALAVLEVVTAPGFLAARAGPRRLPRPPARLARTLPRGRGAGSGPALGHAAAPSLGRSRRPKMPRARAHRQRTSPPHRPFHAVPARHRAGDRRDARRSSPTLWSAPRREVPGQPCAHRFSTVRARGSTG